MRLYTYFRSSAAYRVRIALNLKNIDYDSKFVHLTRRGGEQFDPDYRSLNPQAQVPSLVDDEEDEVFTQSLAIIEYLDEVFPEPALLPEDPIGRARVRALAQIVACDIHPLNNLRVLAYLVRALGQGEEDRLRWYRHWMGRGLDAIEDLLSDNPDTGTFCHGDQPTLADICLVPQVYNARRYDCDLTFYPTIVRIDAVCAKIPAFRDAAPDNQPDAE